jgi:RNA polymerase sigma-70 factor, ECF subfamily
MWSAGLAMTLPAEPAAERDLVARARDGDTAAFEALYRAHVGRVNALCLRMTGNAAQAEDCVQETFVRAWRNLSSFQGASAFGTWVYRIAVNEVLGAQRRDRRRATHLQVVGDEERTEEMEYAAALGGEAGEEMDVEQAVRALPEGARNVFVLVGLHGYSHEETAAALGVAVGTCKAQLHRARQLLMKRLHA